MLSTLFASVLSGEATEAIARARRAALIYILAGLLILCGAGFLLGAAFLWVAREIGTLPAALWFGGGFVGVALVLVIAHRIAASIAVKRAQRRRKSEMAGIASAAAFAILPTLLASKQGRTAAIIVPVLAGLGYAVWRENASRERPVKGDIDPSV